MKHKTILTLGLMLVAGVQSLCAQTDSTSVFQDTCYVALRIENRVEPFVAKNGPDGKPSGMIAYGLNGDVYLYTNRPFVKVINESNHNFRNKNTGEYRVLLFDCGHATTYDFVRQKGGGSPIFQPKNVNNFQNQIYFGGDLQQSAMWFQLENNSKYRRHLQIRQMGGEFGGIDNIQLTVARAGKADTLVQYGDNTRTDSLVLFPGETIKKVSITRFSNGTLNHVIYNDSILPAQFTFRNSDTISVTDIMAARTATLTTADSLLCLEAPGLLSLQYSFMEGDGNAQSECKNIEIKKGVLPTVIEEEDNTLWWILLVLVLGGGIGFYFYRRHQLKKKGIIPETDKEKVVRLTKEVAAHAETIKGLKDVESGLLSDKDNLQKKVQQLNHSHEIELKRLNEALQTSKNETMEKAAESNGYHDQLVKLQEHTEEVQSNLDEAKRQIAVYESGEEQKEIKRLNESIAALKQEHKAELAAAEAQKKQEMAELVAANEEKMNDTRYECETRLTAATSDKDNAVAAAVAEKEAVEARLTSEKDNAIASLTADKEEAVATLTAQREEAVATLTAEKEEAVANITAAKNEAVAAITADRDQQVAAITADRDEKVAAAEADRDEKVAAAEADRDQQVAAAEADRDRKVAAALAEKEDAINRMIIEKDDAINAAISEKEQAIGIAITEKEEAIANALAEKNIAVTAANEERDRAVLAAETEKENTIQAMSKRQAEELSNERHKTAVAEETIRKATSLYIATIERSVDAIVLQVNTMMTEVVDSRYENNYTNVISHLSQKVLDFERWFKKEIVEGQVGQTWSVEEVRLKVQDQLIPALSNNYTWVSEMVRFTSYCAISRQFKDQFRRSGVPTDYLRNAYAETVTLFGRMGITLLVPSLFADDYNPECHKLNNAPLINSFFPHTFMEYKPESKGMIYDVLRPGYSVEGEIKQLPEVCVY